jgi:protein SCO1/2
MHIPPVLDGSAIVTNKLGAKAALDVTLIDDRGQAFVPERDLSRERPTILNLGYYGCPGMCGLVLNHLLERMADSGLVPGRDLNLLTVSVAESETVDLAVEKKRSYVAAKSLDDWAEHWRLTVGSGEQTRKLADSVGWGFRLDPTSNEIDHPPVIVILAADGTISRYLDDGDYTATTLRRAVIEAGDGKVGGFLERLVVTCMTFNPESGRYEVTAMTVVRIGGVVTVFALAAMIILLRRRELRERAQAAATPSPV